MKNLIYISCKQNKISLPIPHTLGSLRFEDKIIKNQFHE